jgi:hypothetical protein
MVERAVSHLIEICRAKYHWQQADQQQCQPQKHCDWAPDNSPRCDKVQKWRRSDGETILYMDGSYQKSYLKARRGVKKRWTDVSNVQLPQLRKRQMSFGNCRLFFGKRVGLFFILTSAASREALPRPFIHSLSS